MESFNSFKPNNEKLTATISYYYFHELTDPSDEVNFLFYPHYKHGFTFYLDENGKVIKMHFSQNYHYQIPVQLKGITRKVGVAFRPLGMNYFIQGPMKNVVDMEHFLFPHWKEDVEATLGQIFQCPSQQERVNMLDDFFMQKLIERDDLIVLQRAIAFIFESFGTITVNELASHFQLSRKTIQRLFNQHLLCSPETYKKVVKFRTALAAAQQQPTLNLTELSLFSLYYDQADFNKRFKELTGQTPKHFFQSIQQMGDEDIFWKR